MIGYPAPLRQGSPKQVIMIPHGGIGEMVGSDQVPDRQIYRRAFPVGDGECFSN